ncbi:MAG: hypothetical protein MMC33_004138 [Icmadophila ericetorum]|nr:hypothetical protein [Icmadophila ericetorum]
MTSLGGELVPPVHHWYKDSSFVRLLETYCLSIAPSVIFLLLALIRTWNLRNKPKAIGGRALSFTKLLAIAIYAALQLTFLVLWSNSSSESDSASIVAAVLSFINTLFIAWLSYTEHFKSLRPSILLGIYLFSSLLFDVVIAVTLQDSLRGTPIQALFVGTLVVKAGILVLESWDKGSYILDTKSQYSPEETVSIFNLAVFYWVNGLIRKGSHKVLLQEDLCPLDTKLRSEMLYKKFWIAWETEIFKAEKPSIIKALFAALKWQFIFPIIPRCFLLGFLFCQPIFIRSLLTYLTSSPSLDNDKHSSAYIGLYAIIYAGLTFSGAFYWRFMYRGLAMVRGCLTSAIYRKSTDISITALDNSIVVTLISTDINKIQDGLGIVHEVWSNAAEIGIATWLLQREIGLACLVPLVVAILSAMGSVWVSSKIGAMQTAWVEKTQRRVGIATTMLSSMKGVKILGLTPKLLALVQVARLEEVRAGIRLRIAQLTNTLFAFMPNMIGPIITFAAFIIVANTNSEKLDTTRIFTSISLLSLLSQPLMFLFQMFPSLIATVISLKRIEGFLLAESRVDRRHLTENTHGNPSKKQQKPVVNGRLIGAEINGPSVTNGSVANDGTSAVVIRNGSFGWTRGEGFLHGLNVSIPRSALTLIIGRVGSGKSTFCKALLGETLGFTGSLDIIGHTKDIAFCDQTPFLINASLKENIVGPYDYDRTWYNSVVDAVALRDDISILPNKDETLVGTDGIILSGGQKHRLAIARAVYARKTLAIFDDVLSGLDADTAQHVFTHIFGQQGLLRKYRTTVILSTHAVQFLPQADKIIVLGDDGRILEEGNFKTLSESQGYVHNLSIQSSEGELQTQAPGTSTELTKVVTQTPPIKELDKRSRHSRDASIYKYYYQAIGGWVALIWLILGTVFAFFYTFPSLWLKWWSDANNEHSDQTNVMYIIIYAILQVLSLVFILLFHGHGATTMALNAGTRLHSVVLETVMSAPMTYFDTTDIGVTTNRFSQDMQLIDGALPMSLNNLGVSLFVTLGQLIIIVVASPYLAAIFPILIILLYFVQNYYLRTSRQLRLMDLEARSPLVSHFLETLTGLVTIRAFDWSEANRNRNNRLLDVSQQCDYLLKMIQRWLNVVCDILTTGLGIIVVSFAIQFRTNSGFTGVALINLMSVNLMMKNTIVTWTSVETSIGAVSRVKSFNEATLPEDQPWETALPPKGWPDKGDITIQNITAGYGSDGNKTVLRDLTLSIKPGEKIGICGRSGAGKSSLALALFRLIELQKGNIMIDGIDITTLPRQEVRSRLNAIPQDPYFLTGSIRLNMDPYGEASDTAIVEALKKVELWETVESQGCIEGEMTITKLSHGQRQLFCLARAILRPSRIIVLDEATSSVDRKTDEVMQRLIREEFRNRTVIAIAHRLETILDFDRIALLREGKLIEFDSPKNLLSRDSAFKSLYGMDKSGRKEDDGEDLMAT